jgi:phosphatidylinositol glycan class A protein
VGKRLLPACFDVAIRLLIQFVLYYRALLRLLVVSTKVGGVPEVLPRHMIIFAKPEEDG